MDKIELRAYLKNHWAEDEYGTMLYDYQDTILLESEGLNESDNFKLMLYIGLKDINNKKIYVKDLIIFKEYPNKIFEVYFRKESAQFCFIAEDGHIELPKFSNINIKKSKVIGNAYDNATLPKNNN